MADDRGMAFCSFAQNFQIQWQVTFASFGWTTKQPFEMEKQTWLPEVSCKVFPFIPLIIRLIRRLRLPHRFWKTLL